VPVRIRGVIEQRSLSRINLNLPGRTGFFYRREYIENISIEDQNTMSNDVKENLKSQATWKRGLYMLLYVIFYTIADIVLFAVIIFQFLLKLFTGETNVRLCKLGQGISTYIYQVLQYMNFNSEYQPYPFGAWPKGEPKISKTTDQGSS
jgi:hypothetical protein